MSVNGGPVVGAPVSHDIVSAAERASRYMVDPRSEPGARPGVVRPLPQCIRHLIRERHRPAFRDLQERTETLDQIQADHGYGHLIFRNESGGIAAAPEISVVRRRPGGRRQHLLLVLRRDVPPSLCLMLSVRIDCFPAEIKRGSSGVDQVQETVRILRVSLDLIAGHPFHGLSAPVGADVREHGAAPGQLFLKQHAQTVQAVIFRSKDIRLSCAFIVKCGREQCFGEVAVRPVVGPLPLSLEAADDRVVSDRLLRELLLEGFISSHQILDDHIHLHSEFPLLILGLAVFSDPFRILVEVFFAVLLRPLQSSLIFLVVVDPLFHAAEDFHLIDRFHSHAQIALEEILVHDGPSDSHRNRSDLEIAHPPQGCHCDCRPCKTEQHLLHILRYRLVIRILNIPAVHAECRKALLRMRGKDRRQVDRSGTFGRIQSPHTLDRIRVHIHRL